MVAAAVGAYVHVFTHFLSAGLFTALGATGLLLALMYTQDNGKNHSLRIGYLVGFAFFTGEFILTVYFNLIILILYYVMS